jgi:hypothetical protein
MDILKEILSVLLFVASIVLSAHVISNEFSWLYLALVVTGFVSAYLIWPSKKRGKRNDENLFLDLLEIIIELPVELLLWLFRLFGRFFRTDSGGIDFDI